MRFIFLDRGPNEPESSQTSGLNSESSSEHSYLPYVVQTGDLGAQASVNTQELLVEQSRQWEAVKGLHTGVVHSL